MALGKFYSVKPTAQRVGDLIELRTQVKIFQALVGSQPTPLASLRTATVNNLSLGCRLISDLSFEIGRNFPMAFFTEPTIMPAKVDSGPCQCHRRDTTVAQAKGSNDSP